MDGREQGEVVDTAGLGAPAADPAGRRVSIPHVPALDGLRGAAVAGVLLFHGGHLLGGYLGVDLFFVLSGFLITTLLLVEAERTSTVGLGGFWARRARRLLPALAAVLVFVALYSIRYAPATEVARIRGDAFATAGYVANWRSVFAGQDYWALFGSPSPLQHTWSLAIEEQFYLLWPLVVVALLAWRRRPLARSLLVVSVALAAVSTTLMIVLYDPANASRVYYGTDTRATAILLGAALAAALAIWGPVRGRVGRTAVEIAGGAGVVVLALAWARLDGQSATLYRGGFLLCGVAAAAVIAAVTHPSRGALSRLFSWRPLCLLGLISYGVYLWHWPIYVLLDGDRTGLTGWPLLALRVATTLVVAIASYVLLEQPIRHGAVPARRWRLVAPAVGIGVLMLVFGATTGAAAPAPSQAHVIDDGVRRAATAPPGTERLLVVGDSVSYYLGVEIGNLAPRPPVVAVNDARVACIFPSGAQAVRHATLRSIAPVAPIPCDTTWENAVRRFKPDRVLVTFWAPGDAEYEYAGRWIHPCQRAYDDLFRTRLEAGIRVLRSAGASVAVANAPYAAADGKHANTRRRTDCVNRVERAAAAAAGAQLIDLFHFVCPRAPKCTVASFGVVLRPDSVHFKGAGARSVDRWLLAQMRSRGST